jgi:tetratricopeptide (TPR) repeat protein
MRFGRPVSGLASTKLDFYTLTLALGFSALAAGAVHLPILAGYAALVLASALVCVFAGRKQPSPLSAAGGLVVCVWLGLSALCLIEALPLPLGWLEHIAPLNADVWSRSLRPFAEPPPAFASLSLAPGRSLIEALKAASYAVVFTLSADLSRRHGLSTMLRMVFGVGVLLAVVTALHQLFEAQTLYGVYRPLTAFEIAPLLNANNRAGFLSLAFFAGLGVLLRWRDKPARVFIAIGLALLLAEILITRSRGGVLGLGLGLALFSALSLAFERRAERGAARLRALATVSGIALAATLLAVAALRRESWQGLFSASTQKLELFRDAWHMIGDHPWFGVGRGAFASVSPLYRGEGGNAVYEHAENFPLQWAAEWGLPTALLALVLLAGALLGLCRRAFLQRSVRRAAVVGVGVLLLQNQVDLGLEVPAVSALLACVLGALFGTAVSERAGPRRFAAARLLAFGAGALALCLVLIGLAPNVRSPASERAALRTLLEENPKSAPPAFWSALHGAIAVFPADPYFPLLGAHAALAESKDALPWVARALERAPENGDAHVLLARALWARGARAQALAALRHALEVDAAQTEPALALARRWRLGDGELAALVPAGPRSAPLLELLAARAPGPEQRQRWLDEWRARAPDDARARSAAALALLGEIERGPSSTLCGERRASCVDELEKSLPELGFDSVREAELRARLSLAQGKKAEAEALLRRACAATPTDVGCGLMLLDLALANDSGDLDSTIRALVASACTSSASCAGIHRALAQRFAGHGQWDAALDHYQRALQEAPSPELFGLAAQAADRLGRPTQAASLRRRAGGPTP